MRDCRLQFGAPAVPVAVRIDRAPVEPEVSVATKPLIATLGDDDAVTTPGVPWRKLHDEVALQLAVATQGPGRSALAWVLRRKTVQHGLAHIREGPWFDGDATLVGVRLLVG